jgi:hypothetical protein
MSAASLAGYKLRPTSNAKATLSRSAACVWTIARTAAAAAAGERSMKASVAATAAKV